MIQGLWSVAGLHGDRQASHRKRFGDWFYALSERAGDAPNDVPTLYKLHGSLNWRPAEDERGETQTVKKDWPGTWTEYAKQLDYSAVCLDGYDEADDRRRPPILLPYWDKRVETGVWLKI